MTPAKIVPCVILAWLTVELTLLDSQYLLVCSDSATLLRGELKHVLAAHSDLTPHI